MFLEAQVYSNIVFHDEGYGVIPLVEESVLAGDANNSRDYGSRKTAHVARDAKCLRQRFGGDAAEEARYRRNVALNTNDQAAAAHWAQVGEAVRTLRFGS
jgi:hypothetical protein